MPHALALVYGRRPYSDDNAAASYKRGMLPFGNAAGAAVGIQVAPWPVWSGSTRERISWRPIQKVDALQWFRQAEAWTRRRELPGNGRVALSVLRALLFRFLNWKTGRLDPSYEALARATDYCRSAVAEALGQLSDLGIIGWFRRCIPGEGNDGRFQLQQITNAYFVCPPSQWHSYEPPPAPPAPDPESWGATPRLADVFDQAKASAGVATLADKRTAAEDLARQSGNDGHFAGVLARLYQRWEDPPE